MKKRGYLLVFFWGFLLLVLVVNLASASFIVGNKSHSIDARYSQNENIRGWMNISLNNELSTSIFQDSRNNSVKLIDLINKSTNRNYTYTCSPIGCSSNYASSNGATSKSFNLSKGQSRIIGLRFTGNVIDINSVSFDLDSNAPAACENQIAIDILDDGVNEVINGKPGSASCSTLRTYGCFNPSIEKEEYLILDTTPYCQKISLPNAPGFKIGAWVKKTSGARALEMSIYDDDTEVANCDLNVTGTGEFSCEVNYTVASAKEYYVCIASTSGTGDYKIRGNSNPVKGCGFFGLPPPYSATDAAYEIFAEPKGFGAVGSLNISDAFSEGRSISSMAYNYILRKYGNLECAQECIVPIKLSSGANQQITLKNLSISYQKSTGIVSENKFYDVIEASPKISSGFGKVSLNDSGFSVPTSIGLYGFALKLNNQIVFSENVNVTDIPLITSLTPISTASGYPTNFVVTANASVALKKFFWDFGDNATDVTTTNKVTHVYNSTGKYKLMITVTDIRNLSSTKTFDVNVSSPANLINESIVKVKTNLDNLKTQTENFSTFSQESINSILNIENITQQATSIEKKFNSAQTDADYKQIISQLLSLDTLPKSVSQTTIADSISFFPERENINLNVIKSIGGSNYDSNNEEKYIDAIILWNQENLNSKVTFREFVGNYNGEFKPVVKVFEMNIQNKGGGAESYFLIMPQLENLGFESGVSAREADGYVYVDVTNMESVSFYTTEDVDFVNLPAFVSPGLSMLSVVGVEGVAPEGKPRWVIFILAIIFLVILGFIVYIILQEWYRKRYESYLFKNRNDLYNMVNYVHHSKKRGLHNKEIAENLRKAKWGTEQIKYVLRKYAGERTGMFEIPLMDLFRRYPKHQPHEGGQGHP